MLVNQGKQTHAELKGLLIFLYMHGNNINTRSNHILKYTNTNNKMDNSCVYRQKCIKVK